MVLGDQELQFVFFNIIVSGIEPHLFLLIIVISSQFRNSNFLAPIARFFSSITFG